MTNSSDIQVVTIIGFNYIHPIAALIERLLKLPFREPNEFQANPFENGFSASLIGLTAFMTESAIRRTQYITGSTEWNATKFLENTFPSYPNLAEVIELFVARDVIAHNHVWEAVVTWHRSEGMTLSSSKKLFGGNTIYDKVINKADMRTHRLRINLFPTRVNRKDAALALRTAGDLFSFLEAKDRRFWYISPQPVEFNGEVLSFDQFLPAAIAALGAA